MLNLKYCS